MSGLCLVAREGENILTYTPMLTPVLPLLRPQWAPLGPGLESSPNPVVYFKISYQPPPFVACNSSFLVDRLKTIFASHSFI